MRPSASAWVSSTSSVTNCPAWRFAVLKGACALKLSAPSPLFLDLYTDWTVTLSSAASAGEPGDHDRHASCPSSRKTSSRPGSRTERSCHLHRRGSADEILHVAQARPPSTALRGPICPGRLGLRLGGPPHGRDSAIGMSSKGRAGPCRDPARSGDELGDHARLRDPPAGAGARLPGGGAGGRGMKLRCAVHLRRGGVAAEPAALPRDRTPSDRSTFQARWVKISAPPGTGSAARGGSKPPTGLAAHRGARWW